MTEPRRGSQIVSQAIEIGPLYGGDTKPDLLGILTWDGGGGYVDLTGATVLCAIRRFDRRRRQAIGGMVTVGTCTLVTPTKGEALLVWTAAAPLTAVPVDPGFYAARWQVTFAAGGVQESQDATFEVLPAAAFS